MQVTADTEIKVVQLTASLPEWQRVSYANYKLGKGGGRKGKDKQTGNCCVGKQESWEKKLIFSRAICSLSLSLLSPFTPFVPRFLPLGEGRKGPWKQRVVLVFIVFQLDYAFLFKSSSLEKNVKCSFKSTTEKRGLFSKDLWARSVLVLLQMIVPKIKRRRRRRWRERRRRRRKTPESFFQTRPFISLLCILLLQKNLLEPTSPSFPEKKAPPPPFDAKNCPPPSYTFSKRGAGHGIRKFPKKMVNFKNPWRIFFCLHPRS